MNSCLKAIIFAALSALIAATARAESPHNLILFVPDGLRAGIVNEATAPTLARLREEGVNFRNSHALFPTFTTANASAFATGHALGDTGDFSNSIYTRISIQGTVTPFLENDAVQRDLNAALGGNYLDEPCIVALAAASEHPRFSTAVIGKLGPVAIFDPAALAGTATLIVDDSTGQSGKDIPIAPEWREAIAAARIQPIAAPARGDNGVPGSFIPDLAQQQYFLEMTLKVVLPQFKRIGRPFVLIYWTRDPDGSQHTQGDQDINGPTSMTAIRVADGALAAIEQELKTLGLYESTNIIVAADHGFSTIAKDSEQGARALPTGFLAVDLAAALQKANPRLKLYDPDDNNRLIDPATTHPSKGDGFIGEEPQSPQVVIAANGGSDLIYLPALGPKGPLPEEESVPVREQRRIGKLGAQIARVLVDHDYVSGLFVDDKKLGKLPGSLTLADIGLEGAAKTPHPAIVVNFRSYVALSDYQTEPILRAHEIADTTYPEGGGMHGSFSRADTWNFMAAMGPDFRTRYLDELPASNADIGTTIAHLLKLQLTPKGKLSGRVLTESLRGHESDPLPSIESHTQVSNRSSNGLTTILQTQTVGGYVYYDAAGFAGRTVGLDAKSR